MVEGVDPAAEAGEHGDPEPVVLDHDRVEARGGARTAVAVAYGDGQQTAQGRPSDTPGHVARKFREGPGVDRVGPGTGGGPQCGKRVVRAQRGRGQRQYGTSYGRHGPMEHAKARPDQGFSTSGFGKGRAGAGRIFPAERTAAAVV